MLKRVIILLIVLFITTLIKAQTNTQNIDRLNEDAEIFMEDEDWDLAYSCYDKLTKLDPENAFFRFQKGRCGLHLPDKKAETIELFEEVKRESPKDPIVLYYLGRAYHSNY